MFKSPSDHKVYNALESHVNKVRGWSNIVKSYARPAGENEPVLQASDDESGSSSDSGSTDSKRQRTVMNRKSDYYQRLAEEGLSLVMHSTKRPKLYRDSDRTCELIESAKARGSLSDRTLRVLGRTNYRGPYYLEYDTEFDEFRKLSLKDRSLQVMADILHISLLRKNYDQAWRAFGLLIRSRRVEFRALWPIGLELLVWRESANPGKRRARAQDEELLNWLMMNFPSHKLSRTSNRWPFLKSSDYFQVLAGLKVSKKDAQGAASQFEDVISLQPHSDDATSHALYGTIALVLAIQDSGSQYLALARSEFDKSVKLGGHVPDTLNQRIAELEESAESDSGVGSE